MADAQGYACCRYCGAEYRLFTIFNRDMQALCNGWKKRHERACSNRSPEERRKWANRYIGKDRYESSIVVDMSHPGFNAGADDPILEFETWFDCLSDRVLEKTGIQFCDQDAVREDFEAGKHYLAVADDIIDEYSQNE